MVTNCPYSSQRFSEDQRENVGECFINCKVQYKCSDQCTVCVVYMCKCVFKYVQNTYCMQKSSYLSHLISSSTWQCRNCDPDFTERRSKRLIEINSNTPGVRSISRLYSRKTPLTGHGFAQQQWMSSHLRLKVSPYFHF